MLAGARYGGGAAAYLIGEGQRSSLKTSACQGRLRRGGAGRVKEKFGVVAGWWLGARGSEVSGFSDIQGSLFLTRYGMRKHVHLRRQNISLYASLKQVVARVWHTHGRGREGQARLVGRSVGRWRRCVKKEGVLIEENNVNEHHQDGQP